MCLDIDIGGGGYGDSSGYGDINSSYFVSQYPVRSGIDLSDYATPVVYQAYVDLNQARVADAMLKIRQEYIDELQASSAMECANRVNSVANSCVSAIESSVPDDFHTTVTCATLISASNAYAPAKVLAIAICSKAASAGIDYAKEVTIADCRAQANADIQSYCRLNPVYPTIDFGYIGGLF